RAICVSCSRPPHTVSSTIAEHVIRDHDSLNLGSALVDFRDLGVAEIALDLELFGVAVTAVNLDRFGRGLHRRLRREQLRHSGFPAAGPSGIFKRRGLK